MRKKMIVLMALLAVMSCRKVPISGRKQLNLMPEATMMSMSFSEYQQFLSKNPPVSPTDPNAQMVQRVGQNIAQAVDRYFREKKQPDFIKGYKWEFHLVNNKEVNAWCMPGGKVVVYTGLLPVTQDETSLAVVLGHEISHAIARHGNERMSQGLLVQLGGVGLDVALSQKPQQTRDIFLQSYGIGSSLGILKYSRTQESEADKLGLVFMAMAGYNPQEAVGFWERMSKQGGGAPPEFLSTHPSDQTRIKDIKAFLPQAMKYYKGTTKAPSTTTK
jgi:predicted Zn-dependent protease